tara:strand:+ start:12243 stop:13190 length:948 start_codon:yes stop_codon:yes gene_type:complete
MGKILKFYEKEYKKLLIIPLLMLLLAFAQLGYQYSTTGDFLIKGVGLKGGTTITINDITHSQQDIETAIFKVFPEADLNTRTQASLGTLSGYIIDVDIITANSEDNEIKLISLLDELYPDKIMNNVGEEETLYKLGTMGSALGENFFKQTTIALLIAFLLMGLVVLIYFKTLVPSLAVILSAASDIIITLAIINMMGMKLSTFGIAGFLLLIGYSVDTDILLTSKVLKKKEGLVMDKIMVAIKTGFKMSLTTIIAVIVAWQVSMSVEIQQIMTIVLIGLLIDLVNTWIQNVGLLRLYLERKSKKVAKVDHEVKYF